ncbi:hypothetical protein [Photobacterium leiognathi]|uniref:hypothetical protein n=1 Tax=Photobacterium leiognathi TaxID=553611 RepID=UPI00273A0651|nr:hypothetical protein [Photobacterium leiognathi]
MTNKDKHHLWQKRLQQQKDAVALLTTGSQQHQLSVQTFYYWQKNSLKSIIVPLPTIAPQSPIIIETPTGYRVSFSNGSALDVLPQLLKMLS